jgi:hypothetical protein
VSIYDFYMQYVGRGSSRDGELSGSPGPEGN